MGQKLNGLTEPFITITLTYDNTLKRFVSECHGNFIIPEHLVCVIDKFMLGVDLLVQKFYPGLAAIYSEKQKQKGS